MDVSQIHGVTKCGFRDRCHFSRGCRCCTPGTARLRRASVDSAFRLAKSSTPRRAITGNPESSAKLARICRPIHRDEIVSGLRDLGIREGDGVLVHSSLSSFGYVVGGADTVIDALLDATGPEGTVLAPTLTGRREDGPASPPVFDVRNTPCWTGRVPTEFMKRPGARRSLHPTHSVSGIGPIVAALIGGHERSLTPCGEESPYYRLAQKGGFILLVGVGQGSNTTIHTAEELAEVPYHMQKEPADTIIIDYEGNRRIERLYLHDWGTPRCFERIDKELLDLGIMRIGKVGASSLRLIKSLPMIEFLVGKLRKEPRYLCR